jgi:hypothetical protein
MHPMITRPNPRAELYRLKDFQRDTVEHVFRRMYEGPSPSHRFLVADEVGLGKTMVARGVIAKVIDHLWETRPEGHRIDIVYVCSNASIARQNLNRLNVLGVRDAALPSRITLLPKMVKGLKHRKVNFISLTPQTSLDLRSNLGMAEERALLYCMLPETWIANKPWSRAALQGEAGASRFASLVERTHTEDIDRELTERFHQTLTTDATGLREAFGRLCEMRDRSQPETRASERDVIGRLRLALATSCLEALEPDLIVLDEFQRFKHLLDDTDQTGPLARKLFRFPDARVLLLSATPYKMYTQSGLDEGDDHYRDFLQTIAFLQEGLDDAQPVAARLAGFRRELYRAAPGDLEGVRRERDAVTAALRGVMVRTERLGATNDRSGMLSEAPTSAAHVEATDIVACASMQRVARLLDQGDVVEFWKSAPYLLNFMDDYQLKERFRVALADPSRSYELARALAIGGGLLDWEACQALAPIDPANARLRALIRDYIDTGVWQMLWLSPSLPYYTPGAPFDGATVRAQTKRLVFSSWNVVPKVVATLISYEVERRLFRGDKPVADDETAPRLDRGARRGLLQFARRDGRLAGMPVLACVYPSFALATLGDPRALASETPTLDVTGVRARVRARIAQALDALSIDEVQDGPEDQSWYWAAPILLDQQTDRDATADWFSQEDLAAGWQGPNGEEQRGDEPSADVDEAGGWRLHVEEARRLLTREVALGRRPDDLQDVLTDLALGGPAVVALRALSRIGGGTDVHTGVILRNEAGWIAHGFRTLFNAPESMALVRGLRGDDDGYWREMLQYGVSGCLQAVMDEYAHVLVEHEGVAAKPARTRTREVAARIAGVLRFRTNTLGVDVITVEGEGLATAQARMRARFAVRFGAPTGGEEAGAARQDEVRRAFNSPFWPFVLCSTSVGQEGLDFHLYCHAIVHWNLPSNPVDLEQREGRIHRYKGHAVRRNVAQVYGAAALATCAGSEADAGGADDVWTAAFELARNARGAKDCDLVPYWVFAPPGGARIERHLPFVPLSEDVARAGRLRRSLAMYRLAFGQSRQDELVAYLQRRFPPETWLSLTDELRIDLSPERAKLEPFSAEEITGFRQMVERARPEADPKDEHATRSVAVSAAVAVLDRYRTLMAAASRPPIQRFTALLDSYRALASSQGN